MILLLVCTIPFFSLISLGSPSISVDREPYLFIWLHGIPLYVDDQLVQSSLTTSSPD